METKDILVLGLIVAAVYLILTKGTQASSQQPGTVSLPGGGQRVFLDIPAEVVAAAVKPTTPVPAGYYWGHTLAGTWTLLPIGAVS